MWCGMGQWRLASWVSKRNIANVLAAPDGEASVTGRQAARASVLAMT